jgi:hypothetical protein
MDRSKRLAAVVFSSCAEAHRTLRCHPRFSATLGPLQLKATLLFPLGTPTLLTAKILDLGYAYLSSFSLPKIAERFLEEVRLETKAFVLVFSL